MAHVARWFKRDWRSCCNRNSTFHSWCTRIDPSFGCKQPRVHRAHPSLYLFFDTQAVLLDAASNLSLVDLMSADVGSSIRLEPRDWPDFTNLPWRCVKEKVSRSRVLKTRSNSVILLVTMVKWSNILMTGCQSMTSWSWSSAVIVKMAHTWTCTDSCWLMGCVVALDCEAHHSSNVESILVIPTPWLFSLMDSVWCKQTTRGHFFNQPKSKQTGSILLVAVYCTTLPQLLAEAGMALNPWLSACITPIKYQVLLSY